MNDLHLVASIIEDVLVRGGDALDVAKHLNERGLLATNPVIIHIEPQPQAPPIRLDHIAEAYRAGRRSRP